MAKKKIVSSTGGVKTDALPESPFFREADRIGGVRQQNGPSGLTVGGTPLEDIAGGHLIPFLNTDQGIAEREAKPHATSSVTRDEHHKKLQRYGDSRLAREPWEGADVMQEIIDAHLPQGHCPKFLSDRVVKRQGMRGWQAVPGAPKYGDMTFASMPEEKAALRNKRLSAVGQAQIREINNEFQEKQERDFRDAGMRPEQLRGQRDGLDSGLHSTRGEFAE